MSTSSGDFHDLESPSMIENTILTSYLDKSHSHDIARQVETAEKATIFLFATGHNFHVALEGMLYCDWKTSRCCNGCIFSLSTSEVLRHATSFLLHSSGLL